MGRRLWELTVFREEGFEDSKEAAFDDVDVVDARAFLAQHLVVLQRDGREESLQLVEVFVVEGGEDGITLQYVLAFSTTGREKENDMETGSGKKTFSRLDCQ